MTNKFLHLLSQVDSLETSQLRSLMKEFIQVADDMSGQIDYLSKKVRELDSRTVGLCK
jgi:hypothetical protein